MAEPHPLQYFDRIFVINLPSRADRRAEMDRQLRAIGLSLETPPVELFPAARPKDAGGFETVGTRGCFMSHLGVLKKSVATGCSRIAIFEDDLNFVADFGCRLSPIIDRLKMDKWGIFYGGHRVQGAMTDDAGVQCIPPGIAISTTHFIALSSPAMELAVEFFETLLARRSGDPEGGPMHVDGAYSWLRQRNPTIITYIAVPELGYQRSSRTDVHELRWFDRIPMFREVAGVARVLKNVRANKKRMT